MTHAGTKARTPLATVRASVIKMQKDGERVVGRVRRDARALIERSRSEVLKEVRGLERRVLKGIHAATEEQVARLERRIAKLEQMVAELRRVGGAAA